MTVTVGCGVAGSATTDLRRRDAPRDRRLSARAEPRRLSARPEQPVTRTARQPAGREPLLVQPSLQRVGTEVLLHHQHGGSRLVEASQPPGQELAQGRLADADGRVRPDRRESHVLWHLARRPDPHVADTVAPGVVLGQMPCTLVGVDGPDGRTRCPKRQRECQRTRPAAEVEQIAGLRRWRRLPEQECGARVDMAMREHAAVGVHRESDVGEGDVDGADVGSDIGGLVEVVRHCLQPGTSAPPMPPSTVFASVVDRVGMPIRRLGWRSLVADSPVA